MRGINKFIGIGVLGRDPETKTFPNGGSITQFSIAVSEKWKDKNTGETKENTEWIRIVLNNRLGEIAQQHLRKGSKVYIEGSLRTRKWTDQNGQEQFTTEIRGDQMQMLDDKRQDQSSNHQTNGQQAQAPSYNGYSQNGQQTKQGNQGSNQASYQQRAPADLDDNLPF